MSEKKGIWKKLIIMAIVIITVFGVINAVWYFGLKVRYNKIERKLAECETVTIFGTEDVGVLYNGCVVGVKQPSYIQNGGFVTFTDIKEYEPFINIGQSEIVEEDDISVTLMYWPQIFGDDRYGVDICQGDVWEQIYIDKDGNYVSLEDADEEMDEYLQSLLDEYRGEIDELLNVAKKLIE